MHKVSICIPTYNNKEGVIRLLDSIKEQEYSNYEVIITDDSTNDDIKNAVNSNDIPDIKYFKNASKMGATANWNEAIRKASGEYIKIMHHDDWFTDCKSLGRFVQMLDENEGAILAFSGTIQVEPDKTFARSISDANESIIEENCDNLFLGNTIGAPSAVIHRRTEFLYDENLTWLVDMEFYMHLLHKNPHFTYTKEPLISIGISEAQLTEQCITNKKINLFEYSYIYNQYHLKDKKYKNKMIDVLLHNDGSYADAQKCGIVWYQYLLRKAGYFFNTVYYKMKLILTNRK